MNKHDYIHMFKAINKHIVEAQKIVQTTRSIFPEQDVILKDHLEKAKDALWVVADDMAIELNNGG